MGKSVLPQELMENCKELKKMMKLLLLLRDDAKRRGKIFGSWFLTFLVGEVDEYWWVLMNMWWTLKNNWEKNILLFLIFERKVRVIFSVCELWECYVIICGSKEYIECDMGHGFGPKWMNMVNGPQNNTNK